ncbi:MAG: T9SS type A sorting domain-containing protein [Bacteroidales bacterium]|nr:T9SS type A sorting domain-containing protein [Bacteroidales bacterium]
MPNCARCFCIVALSFALLLWGNDAGAQESAVSAGATLQSAMGQVDYSLGQVFCDYATGDSKFYDGEGVQQPYCLPDIDTLFYEICRGDTLDLGNFYLPPDLLQIVGHHQYTNYFSFSNWCGRTVVLDLHVYPEAAEQMAVREQFSYTYGDSTFSETGVHQYFFPRASQHGCDSILTLYVFISSGLSAPHIEAYGNVFLMVDHYPNGTDHARVDWPNYRWYRDGQLLDFTGDQCYDFRNGAYQSLSGCYYVDAYHHPSGTWLHSNVICFNASKSTSVEEACLQLSPNPAPAGSRVVVSLPSDEGTLSIFDMHGRELMQTRPSSPSFIMPILLPVGTYIVSHTSSHGFTQQQKLIVR